MDMLEKVTQTTINLLLDVSDANCVKTMPNNRKVFFPPINLVYTPRQHVFKSKVGSQEEDYANLQY